MTGQLVPGSGRTGHLDQAVVYVESADGSLDRFLPPNSDYGVITFRGGDIRPAVSVAYVGSHLHIRNDDLVYHQPFSRSPAAPFELESIRPREVRTVEFRAPGLVHIYCQLHAKELGDVLVVSNGAWARPDARGRFRLPRLPRGNYVVHAWHPQAGEGATPLRIEHPGPVTVDVRCASAQR